MISNNFIEVSNKLTKLNQAFYDAKDLSFKKIWLDKWNEVAKSNRFIKERKFLLEVNGIANDN